MMKCRSISVLFLVLFFAPASVAQQSPPSGADEPLTIARAVAEALEKNLDLIAERYSIPIAEARIVTAKRAPTLHGAFTESTLPPAIPRPGRTNREVPGAYVI